ncbi:MAG: hypothetical protein JNG85_14815 [Spirochaetaceae bacterium]|nr:hypothetical protein [Spirochaetaceae bacterium]
MLKAHLVVLEREKAEALAELKRLGVVHLEPLAGKGADFEGAARRLAEVERSIGLVSSIKPPKEGKGAAAKGAVAKGAAKDPAKALSGAALREAGLEASRRCAALSEELKAAQDEGFAIVRELERVADWGDFEPALVAELSTAGLPLRFFEGPAARLGALPEGLEFVRLAAPRGRARVAVLDRGQPAALPSDFIEFALPAEGPTALRAARDRAAERRLAADAGLAALAPSLPALEAARDWLAEILLFEQVKSGMGQDEGLSYLSGFVPAKDLPALKAAAQAHAWGLVADEPSGEELPPSKVENGPLVRVIAPVFDFLGTVPNYREYDISGLFLFFFCFFFAMIFGDGGYGSLLLLGGVFAALKAKKAKGFIPDPIRLLLILAGSTVAWGVMTASWFGLPPDRLPAVLRSIAVYWLSNENPASGDNVKMLCFLIGTVQLVVAHLKNIKRDLGSLKFLAQIGQLAMVAGMLFLVLNLVISADRFPLPTWALYLVAGGFGLNFIFASYDGSRGFLRGVVGGIVSSLANIVSVFLGVVNVFADIVSYIRLWAVGLAGIAISQTVNNMAGPMFGSFVMFAVGVLLLVFGHGLNIMMSVLSVIVHGVRLNMLEFSGHLGMEWSGYKYEPFRATAPEERE